MIDKLLVYKEKQLPTSNNINELHFLLCRSVKTDFIFLYKTKWSATVFNDTRSAKHLMHSRNSQYMNDPLARYTTNKFIRHKYVRISYLLFGILILDLGGSFPPKFVNKVVLFFPTLATLNSRPLFE